MILLDYVIAGEAAFDFGSMFFHFLKCMGIESFGLGISSTIGTKGIFSPRILPVFQTY